MADVDVMAAIIEQHAVTYFKDWKPTQGTYRCTAGSAEKAAKALYEAGFRMSSGSVDQGRDARLRAIEGRLDRIEGYMVIPS